MVTMVAAVLLSAPPTSSHRVITPRQQNSSHANVFAEMVGDTRRRNGMAETHADLLLLLLLLLLQLNRAAYIVHDERYMRRTGCSQMP